MKTKVLCSVCAAVVISLTSVAATQEILERRSSANAIRGSVNPEKIPYALKMRWLFRTYDVSGRKILAPNLSEADVAILEGAIGAQDDNLASEASDHSNKFLALCSTMESMDATTLATQYEDQAAEFLEIEGNRYKSLVSQLSDSGRKVVAKHMGEYVTPKIQLTQSSSYDLARDDPKRFMFSMKHMCDVERTGGAQTQSSQQKIGVREP